MPPLDATSPSPFPSPAESTADACHHAAHHAASMLPAVDASRQHHPHQICTPLEPRASQGIRSGHCALQMHGDRESPGEGGGGLPRSSPWVLTCHRCPHVRR
nr:unnamed protein product [Digitaria exilis]